MSKPPPTKRVHRCPRCGIEVAVEAVEASDWRPFCSQRCQMLDLGDWVSERFRIAADESAAELADRVAHTDPDANV